MFLRVSEPIQLYSVAMPSHKTPLVSKQKVAIRTRKRAKLMLRNKMFMSQLRVWVDLFRHIFPSRSLNAVLHQQRLRYVSSLSWFYTKYWYGWKLFYLRAAAPAADPGRIGKEAKQIGIKTLRCFAPWGFRPFSYVYCCEIYLIGLNFHL